jgi:hypothetical protein
VSIAGEIETIVVALQPLAAEIPGLQILGYLEQTPSPPTIDIYPDTPFQEGSGFGGRSKQLHWIVRARVSNTDSAAAAATLYRLLDVTDAASVEVALAAVDVVVGNDGTVTGFTVYVDDHIGDMIGCNWRTTMFL